ncbi:RNA binding protein fox-1 homolog 2-like [Carassius carassius]|uniref:RNA binding protein fox-1 homolog 2-like n=1 Tax=Carassius carassius TaxID=217509 RepID=UPI002868547B|nr:RNA binding protein fox-1 homolog 2-like [Carassius carassius]
MSVGSDPLQNSSSALFALHTQHLRPSSMLMSTDVASVMLPVSHGILEHERDLDSGSAAARGMKRGDPEPEGGLAAGDSIGAECKRARMDGTEDTGQASQDTMGAVEGVVAPFSSFPPPPPPPPQNGLALEFGAGSIYTTGGQTEAPAGVSSTPSSNPSAQVSAKAPRADGDI